MFKFIKLTRTTWISLGLAVSVLAGLQISTWGTFADPDGFYHAKASQLLAAGELGDTFPWLAYTTWKDGYADQHYLYHWLLVPFNTVPLLPLSIIVFGAVFLIAFWALMSELKIFGRPLWLLLLVVGSADFIFRINIVKANALSLALLCAIGIMLYRFHNKPEKKWLGLIALLSGVFAWTYGGFICAPLFVGAYCTAVLLTERRLNVWPLLASVIGIALALLIHPHSSHIFQLLYDQLFQTGLGAGSVVPAGNEWSPFDLSWFVKSNLIVLIPWTVALAIEIKQAKQARWLTVWLHIVALGFLVLTLWHRRFVEYWTPFTVLAAASTLTPFLSKVTWDDFKLSVQSFWQLRLLIVSLAFLVVFSGAFNIQQTYRSLAAGESGVRFRGAAEWIADHSEAGDLVLNTQWDQSPQLFYWNSKNYYLVGLDPTFMYLYDQQLYWDWRKVVDQPNRWLPDDDIYKIIKEELKTKYVFIDSARNGDFAGYLAGHPELFELSFTENFVEVYTVK